MHVMAGVLIPGRGAPIEAGAVVMERGVITYAGPAAAAPSRAPDDEIVEVPVAMPGLWDCHAHFFGTSITDGARLVTLDPLTSAARAVGHAARVLDGGVTSVRDTGGPGLSLAPAVADGDIRGPRIHAAGHILSTTGGHGDLHSLPLDVAHLVTCTSGLSHLCDGVPECLLAVRKNLRRNAKLIKVCASGGVMSEVDHPMHQQFSDEELAAIVGEAARAERIVAAHCHGKDGIMAALRAGCRTIEHGTWLDEEAADLMVETGAMLVPTRFIVQSLLDQVDSLPSHVVEKVAIVADTHERAVALALDKGVRIAAGCDIFVTEGYGHAGREVANLIAAGMTDLQAIEAATASAPDTLGPQAPKSGQLVEGFDADVIALAVNPLEDRSVWGDPGRVTHVWQAGQLVKNPG